MDMVGRLDKKLILQGIGSSSIWRSEIERRNVSIEIREALELTPRCGLSINLSGTIRFTGQQGYLAGTGNG